MASLSGAGIRIVRAYRSPFEGRPPLPLRWFMEALHRIQDPISGTRAVAGVSRMAEAAPGDVIVVHTLDRLGRNLREVLNLVQAVHVTTSIPDAELAFRLGTAACDVVAVSAN